MDFNPSSRPIVVSGPVRPLAPEGIYTAKFVGHRTLSYYGPRVELVFEIIPSEINRQIGGRFGLFLSVKRLIGPEGANGEFEPKGPRSKFAKFIKSAMTVIDHYGEISMRDLLPLSWEITLIIPLLDSDGNKIPVEERYSVISKAIPVILSH